MAVGIPLVPSCLPVNVSACLTLPVPTYTRLRTIFAPLSVIEDRSGGSIYVALLDRASQFVLQKYYKTTFCLQTLTMTSSSFSPRFSTTHRRPSRDLVAAVVLFLGKGIYELVRGKATVIETSFDNQSWFNPGTSVESGRYRCRLVPM